MGDTTTPNPPFWPFLTHGVVLCHLGVVFPPQWGWVYPPPPHLVIFWEGYHPFGVVLSPLFGDFIHLLGGGGGGGVVTLLGVWPISMLT